MAEEISENAPLSVRGTKLVFTKILKYQTLDPQDSAELEILRDKAYTSEDAKEAQRAFMEKRKPAFKGR